MHDFFSPEASQDFALLDTFDQDLRRSGRLLLATSRTLLLCQPDGLIITQTAGRRHFVADLPEGPVKAALADLSALRCLLPQGQGHITSTRLALLADADKTCVRAHLRLLTTDRGSALLVTLQGLRGYDKALETLRQHLECCGARSPLALHEALPGLPAYRAKPEIEIGPQDTAFDAVTRIVAAYLPVLRANGGASRTALGHGAARRGGQGLSRLGRRGSGPAGTGEIGRKRCRSVMCCQWPESEPIGGPIWKHGCKTGPVGGPSSGQQGSDVEFAEQSSGFRLHVTFCCDLPAV